MAKIDINSDQWCKMVFEDRNTDFGAFVLRTQSSKRHLRALIIASIIFIFAITAPILIKEVMKNVKKADTSVRTIDYLDQVKKETKEEKPIEEIPQEQQPIQNVIAFAPVITEDKYVKDDTLPSQSDLNKTRTNISTITVTTGTDDRTAAMPTVQATITEAKTEDNTIYNQGVIQVQPNFPGGMSALYDYLNKNIVYPPSAREAGIEGKVIIGFVVGKNGRVSEVQVLRSLDPACDDEAVKLVKSMPAWSPGKQGDKTVRVRMTLPIVFRLDN